MDAVINISQLEDRIASDAHDVGVMYFEKHNYEKAIYYFKISSANNNYFAMYQLSHIYNSVPEYKDIKLAIEYCTMAVNNGYIGALYDLAELHYANSSVHNNLINAMKYYKFASEYGCVDAMMKLAFMYEHVVPNKNLDEAIKYYELAHAHGNMEAVCRLAFIYEFEETKRDIPMAIKFYKIAIEKKFNVGQVAYRLATIYYHKPDMRNIDEAIKYYKMAIANQCGNASYWLQHLYKNSC